MLARSAAKTDDYEDLHATSMSHASLFVCPCGVFVSETMFPGSQAQGFIDCKVFFSAVLLYPRVLSVCGHFLWHSFVHKSIVGSSSGVQSAFNLVKHHDPQVFSLAYHLHNVLVST